MIGLQSVSAAVFAVWSKGDRDLSMMDKFAGTDAPILVANHPGSGSILSFISEALNAVV
jgi:hypothetical protein